MMVIPSIFELTGNIVNQSCFEAALVLAVTPVSMCLYSMILNRWVENDIKQPIVFGQILFIISAYFYIQSFKEQ